MPIEVWDWFVAKLPPGVHIEIVEPDGPTRGVTLNRVFDELERPGYVYACAPRGLRWDDIAIYMNADTLCELVEAAHGDVEGDSDGE